MSINQLLICDWLKADT